MTSHRSKKVACFPGSSTFNSSFLGYIFVKNDRNFAISFTAYRSSINLYTPLYLQSLVVPNEINLDILRLNKNKEIRLPSTERIKYLVKDCLIICYERTLRVC